MGQERWDDSGWWGKRGGMTVVSGAREARDDSGWWGKRGGMTVVGGAREVG